MNQVDKIKEIQEQIDYLDMVAHSFQIQLNELKFEIKQTNLPALRGSAS